jgi:arabinofuranosyltransferase
MSVFGDAAKMTDRAGNRRESRERWMLGALLLTALAGLWVHAGLRDFVSDDAFITFRYARNLLDGHGLVYNTGERVEGFSSPLHVLLVSAMGWFGLDLVAVGRGLGLLAAGVITVLAGVWAARSLEFPWSIPGAALAAGLVAANPSVAIWSLGGLETTVYAALILACPLPLFLGPAGSRAFVGSSVIAALATWTRPEGAVTFAALTVAFMTSRSVPRRRRLTAIVAGALIFAGVVGIWIVFRVFYYGELLPNTYYVKSAFTSSHLVRGWDYLRGFLAMSWVPPAFAFAAIAVARDRPGARLLGVVLGAQILTVLLVGGDGLPAYRFLVPAVAPLAVLAALGADVVREWASRLGRAVSWVTAAACLALVALVPHVPRDNQFVLYEGQKEFEIPTLTLAGKWLREGVPEETVIATVPIGAVGYYSELPVIDMLGLTDRHIANRKVGRLGSGWAGHEKTDGGYVLSRRPDLLLLGNVWVSDRYVAPTESFPPWTNRFIWARESDVARDPRFEREYARRSVRIGPEAWLNLWIRRDVAFAMREWRPGSS